MAESERLVKFELLGQSFAFYTGASEEEMEAILSLVRRQVEDNGGEPAGSISVSKVAVMACLNIASRYVRLKNDFEQYKAANDSRISALGDKLRAHLVEENDRNESF